jgi:hypothetical protein
MMIEKKSNLLVLLIFFSAQASENIEIFNKYKYYIFALSAFSATAALIIPMYLKSRETTLDGVNLFERSAKEALLNFRMSGNLYSILSIEKSIIPNILHEYETYPQKNAALLKSFSQFKIRAHDYKYNLHQNNPALIKKIKTIYAGLPQDVHEIVDREIESLLINPKLNTNTTRKIEICEKKLVKEISQ